jgi:hypothetical protein
MERTPARTFVIVSPGDARDEADIFNPSLFVVDTAPTGRDLTTKSGEESNNANVCHSPS